MRAIQALVPAGAVLLSGSRGADLHASSADVDLVVVVRGDDRAAAFNALAAALEACRVGVLHVLRSAYTPVIKLLWNGTLPVDIIVAATPDAIQCEEWIALWTARALPEHQLARAHMDDASLRAINSLRVCALLGRQPESVKQVMREARAWARARGLYGSQLGFWGGVAWSLFVLYTRATSLREVLASLLAHAWPQPLFFEDNERAEEADEPDDKEEEENEVVGEERDRACVCAIYTPALPRMNCTFTCNVITLREMQLQAEDTLAGDVGGALATKHAVHITCASYAVRDLVMTRARHLLLALERPDVFVRPCARFSARGVMSWGLQPLPGAWTAALQSELEATAREWCARACSGAATVSIV